MKRFFKTLLISFTFILISCEKESIKPKTDSINDSGSIENTISIFGDWLLIDGKMYVENLETGEKIVYNHFDQNKNTSSLNYNGDLQFEIDKIVKDSTIWTFTEPDMIPGYGEFWLNNDSLDPYGFYLTNSNMTITEYNVGDQKMGGTSMPIKAYINDYNTNYVDFYVKEKYFSNNGVNYKSFSKLTFKKK